MLTIRKIPTDKESRERPQSNSIGKKGQGYWEGFIEAMKTQLEVELWTTLKQNIILSREEYGQEEKKGKE